MELLGVQMVETHLRLESPLKVVELVAVVAVVELLETVQAEAQEAEVVRTSEPVRVELEQLDKVTTVPVLEVTQAVAVAVQVAVVVLALAAQELQVALLGHR